MTAHRRTGNTQHNGPKVSQLAMFGVPEKVYTSGGVKPAVGGQKPLLSGDWAPYLELEEKFVEAPDSGAKDTELLRKLIPLLPEGTRIYNDGVAKVLDSDSQGVVKTEKIKHANKLLHKEALQTLCRPMALLKAMNAGVPEGFSHLKDYLDQVRPVLESCRAYKDAQDKMYADLDQPWSRDADEESAEYREASAIVEAYGSNRVTGQKAFDVMIAGGQNEAGQEVKRYPVGLLEAFKADLLDGADTSAFPKTHPLHPVLEAAYCQRLLEKFQPELKPAQEIGR